MLVSKAWAALVLSTPQLWAFVASPDNSGDESSLRNLERSGDSSLTVRLGSRKNAGAALEQSLQLISNQITRWGSAHIVMTRQNLSLLSRPAPRLQDLALLDTSMPFDYNWSAEEDGEFLGGYAPRLADVYITSICLPWRTSPVFKNLSVLRLVRLQFRQLTPEDLFGLMESSQDTLCTLELADIGLLRGYSSEEQASMTMTIPPRAGLLKMERLKVFILGNPEDLFWQVLGDHVFAPNCGSLTTHSLFGAIPEGMDAFIVRQLAASLSRKEYPAIDLEIARAGIVLCMGERGDPGRFQWSSTWSFENLVDTLHREPTLSKAFYSHRIRLVVGNSRSGLASFNSALRRFDADHVICSRGSWRLAGATIMHLAGGTDYGRTCLVLPRLKILEVLGGTWYEPKDILELVNNRLASANGPSALQRLVVHPRRRLTEAAFAELKRIMGEGNVLWMEDHDGSGTESEEYSDGSEISFDGKF